MPLSVWPPTSPTPPDVRTERSLARALAWLKPLRANPTLAAVSAEGFLTRFGFSMVGLALPLFALSLGMSLAEVGFLYALRTVSTVAVKPVMGWAADRYGRKSTLVLAIVLRCVVGVLFIFAAEPWHLYALRVLQGVMTAARDPSAAALLATHGTRKSMASTFAWYSTARDVGKSLGYGGAGLLIHATGSYRVVFLFAFLTSCVALAMVLRSVVERPASASADTAPVIGPREPASTWRRYRPLLPYATFGLMVASSAEMMQGLFPVIAVEYAHLTEGQTGLAASASSVGILVAGPLFAWLSDHVSRKLALGARSVANGLSSVLYIFAPSFVGFMVAKVVDDSGKAAFRPTWGAILAEASDLEPDHRARTMTFLDSASTLGEIAGPLAASLLLAAFGIPGMLTARVALAVLTEAQSLSLRRH
jgi:MFS family permease